MERPRDSQINIRKEGGREVRAGKSRKNREKGDETQREKTIRKENE